MSSVTTTAEFLRPGEIAAILGCKVNQVLHFIHAGELAAMDIGTGRRASWRIHRDDFSAFRKTKTVGGSEEAGARPRFKSRYADSGQR